MTMPSGRDFTTDDAEKLGDAIGPRLREDFARISKSQSDTQTGEIRAMLTHHDQSVRQTIQDHAEEDKVNFAKGDERMGGIETKLQSVAEEIGRVKWFISIVVGTIVFLTPFLVEWVKHVLKW